MSKETTFSKAPFPRGILHAAWWTAVVIGTLLPGLGQASAQVAAPAPAPPAAIELRGTTSETSVPKSRPATAAPAAPQPAPRTGIDSAQPGNGTVNLVALLADDGQRIDQGLVWHVFQETLSADGRGTRPVINAREAAPTLRLPAGEYVVTATFGRAHLTRRIAVKAGAAVDERFVLNAGGLRLNSVMASGEPTMPNSITYEILSDDRDQSGNRTRVVAGVGPAVIIRLNAGIYHVVATVGDANAQVGADVTVEAGKLTEAIVSHDASRVTFKLVPRAGGEALADTQWTITSAQGGIVKETAGALPSHILSPGTYRAVAKSNGRTYQRDFMVPPAQPVYVEIVMP